MLCALSDSKPALSPLQCDSSMVKEGKGYQKQAKLLLSLRGGSVSSALLVMVNCCTHILKQESLCQKVHVALEKQMVWERTHQEWLPHCICALPGEPSQAHAAFFCSHFQLGESNQVCES